MEDVFFVIRKTELEELFNSDTINFKDIKDKLLDQKVEIEKLKEKVEDLEEELKEIKEDREENYTPNPTNHYIDLGLRESDFH